MIIHDCKQGTPYWHTIRLGKVTGSMFAIAKGNGQGRKDYMDALIEELRTGRPRESFVNKHMQRGTEMEPFARAAYEKETGVKVQEVGFVEFNENIGVSPDGMIEPGGRLEIKCPTLEVHNKTVQTDKVPSSHKPQIQGTLWVTEGKWLDFVSYHPDAETPLFVKRVYPDEAYITELKIRIYMFIADMKAMMKETEADTKGTIMNFAAVEQANGQNVNMQGTILEIKGEGVNQKSGKPWKKVVITDGAMKHQVTLRGTLPGPEMINQRAEFAISTFQGQSPEHGAYQGYSGFWNSTVQVQGVGVGEVANAATMVQTPQQNNQAGYQPQNQSAPPAPQQTYTPPSQATPERDTGLSIERQASFKAACHRFQGMAEATNAEIMTLAALGANFCVTGHASCAEPGSAEDFADKYNLPPELE